MARTKVVPTEGLLSDLEYTSVIVSYSNGIDSTGALVRFQQGVFVAGMASLRQMQQANSCYLYTVEK